MDYIDVECKNAGICPYCGKKMTKHIIKEGARFHVHSYHDSKNGATVHCSEPDCEDNHGPGHCVRMGAKSQAVIFKIGTQKFNMTNCKCGNCLYYNIKFGKCKRYPPSIRNRNNFDKLEQPDVDEIDVCGEWKHE